VQIINDLRKGIFDVLVGINLLREGLDIPEVSLVCILDADKEGFLRSQTALIQTCGRAARNIDGHVVMYADKITKSIQGALDTTKARRSIQQEYNEKHGIIPQTIQKRKIEDLAQTFANVIDTLEEEKITHLTTKEIEKKIKEYEKKMKVAAKEMRFEDAAAFRDQLQSYKELRLLEEEI
jgi:excinuclease ABC subunit B